MPVSLSRWGVEGLHSIATQLRRGPQLPPHLAVGLRGEREALFALRQQGYTIVARRWTSPKLRGDVDLVAWESDWLCFVEVKTRSERSPMAPAETAVDREKQVMLRKMARAYLQRFDEDRRRTIAVRFDIVVIYLNGGRSQSELFRGAFGWH